uniref:CCDC66 domain-containing protein n=1 Tax=Strongyloides venezuelensis TaxID=75913 RepID=A0A0K0EVP5_STRVS
MVRTYNWNPSTQTNVKLGENLHENYDNDRYEVPTEKGSWSNNIRNSDDLIDERFSKINNTTNYIMESNSSYPPLLKTTNTLSSNPSFLTSENKNNYLPSVMEATNNSNIIDCKEKISFQNPLDISWNVPPEILEGRTFIVGMKAYSIHGNIFYQPLSVKNAFSSMITENEQNKHMDSENSTLNINSTKMEYNLTNKIEEENLKKLFDVERANNKNYYENKLSSSYIDNEMSKTIGYANDQKLPTIGNGRLIYTSLNGGSFNTTKSNKTFVPCFNDKERHKHELLQQIEENKRRKEIERYKEWEMEERRRISDERYLEKQRNLIKEEAMQSKRKMEMVQKKAEAIAARASEMTKHHLNIKNKSSGGEKKFNNGKVNGSMMSEEGMNGNNLQSSLDNGNRNHSDCYNLEDKLSIKSLTSHNSIHSTSSSSPSKRLEWWEKKMNNDKNVRTTTSSPPIPVLRNKMKDESNSGVNNNIPTNYEHTCNDGKLINTFENETNNERGEHSSVSSTKSKNLSATAESLQRQLRLTNHQQILT